MRLKLAGKEFVFYYYESKRAANITSYRFQFIVERASFNLSEWKLLLYRAVKEKQASFSSCKKRQCTKIKCSTGLRMEGKNMDISCSNLLNLMGKLVFPFIRINMPTNGKRQTALTFELIFCLQMNTKIVKHKY